MLAVLKNMKMHKPRKRETLKLISPVHDDDTAGAGEGDDEEGESAKLDADNCAKYSFPDEVTVKSRAKEKNPCVPCFYLILNMNRFCPSLLVGHRLRETGVHTLSFTVQRGTS
jgi:hypothetical protein